MSNSAFLEANAAVQQEMHSLKCKANMCDFSNYYTSYLSVKDKAKQIEVLQLPKFQQFVSDHKFVISLPEQIGIIGIKVTNQCNIHVFL